MELREPLAYYLSPIQRTELGEFPCDWRVVSLEELKPFVTSGSRGWAAFYSEIGSTFLRITNLSRTRIYPSLDDLRYVSVPVGNNEGVRTALKNGDVLISITADIGIVGLVTSEIDLPAYINQHIALVRFGGETVNSRYLAYFLAGARSQRRFKSMTDAGAKAGMNLAGVRSILAALPPTNDEQGAIAEALTDADTLVDSLEKLLTKKRQLKQGAMQELLTGKRRLPGFQSQWENDVIGRVVVELIAGVSVNSETQESGIGIPSVVKTSALKGGLFDAKECKTIRQADLARATTQPRKDTLLISRMNTPDLVGEVGYVDQDYDWLYLPDRIWMTRMRSSSSVCVQWLAYLLSSPPYKRLIGDTATGTSGSMKNIAKSALLNIPVSYPTVPEQRAIAQVLSDMDTEIAAIEARLAKARDLKQAMAQALLTGRIRLMAPQA